MRDIPQSPPNKGLRLTNALRALAAETQGVRQKKEHENRC